MDVVLQYEVEDHIAFVTLDRPAQRNALNLELRRALVEAWKAIEADADVWIAIITGNGKAFSAGHDLKEELTAEQKRQDPDAIGLYGGLVQITKPTIAAINGPCLAQGAGMALLADIRLAAEDATFGWPQVKLGISSVSGPAVLCRIIPHNLALEYLFTGDAIPARRALELGMVNRVVDSDRLASAALDMARRILQSAPLSLRAIKEATLATRQLDQVEAFGVAAALTADVNNSEDAREGRAAFAEKRTPVWRAR